MSYFIRCTACGFCLGNYMEFYIQAKHALTMKKIVEKAADINVTIPAENLSFMHDFTTPMKPIFEALKITNECCRKTANTFVDMPAAFR